MSEVKRRRVDQILDPSYLEGLSDRSIDEVLTMRDECAELENGISYERRLCQGRIDILCAERDQRGDDEVSGDLISRLPQILGDQPGSGGGSTPLPTRAPDLSIPRNIDLPARRVEEIAGDQVLARLAHVPIEELAKIIETLVEHERALSDKRRRVHEVVDALHDEIVKRYSSGEADPDGLLR